MHNFRSATCNKRYLDHLLEVSAVPTEQFERTRIAGQVEKCPEFISTATLYLAICDAAGLPVLTAHGIIAVVTNLQMNMWGSAWWVCCCSLLVAEFSPAACDQRGGAVGKQYVRPPASADLSILHPRLARSNDSPHSPEQIHIAMAGMKVHFAFCQLPPYLT